jgi:hypothetical protein
MAWKTVEQDERTEIMRAISWAQPAFRRDPARCAVDTLELPFYPGSQLLKVTARELPGKPLWYVRLPQRVVVLDRQSESVNHCNASAPLVLTDKTIYSYLKFWYYFTADQRVFEAKVKRSAVGYTGKVWLYDHGAFHELDVNVSPRGTVTALDKSPMPGVPNFEAGEFSL